MYVNISHRFYDHKRRRLSLNILQAITPQKHADSYTKLTIIYVVSKTIWYKYHVLCDTSAGQIYFQPFVYHDPFFLLPPHILFADKTTWVHVYQMLTLAKICAPRIILRMCPANERWCYKITSSLIHNIIPGAPMPNGSTWQASNTTISYYIPAVMTRLIVDRNNF